LIKNEAKGYIRNFINQAKNRQDNTLLNNEGTIYDVKVHKGRLTYYGTGVIAGDLFVGQEGGFVSASNSDNVNLEGSLSNEGYISAIINNQNIITKKPIFLNGRNFSLLNSFESSEIDTYIINYSPDASIVNHGTIMSLENRASIKRMINTSMNTLKTFTNNAGKTVDIVDNTGRFAKIENHGTIKVFNNTPKVGTTNTGLVSEFNNSGLIENLNNSATIAQFKNSGTVNLDTKGDVNAFEQSSGFSNITNSGTLKNLNISGGKVELKNKGTIESFKNNNANVTIDNEGIFTQGIQNQGVNSLLYYKASYNKTKSDVKRIAWNTANNNEKFHFKNDNGKINILSNSIILNISKSDTAYNKTPDISLLSNSDNGHLVVAGSKTQNISFAKGSLVVNPLEGFSFRKDYDFKNVVFKNDNGTLKGIGYGSDSSVVNNNKGLDITHLSAYESLYTIERGSREGTFRIGVDPSKGFGAVFAKSSVVSGVIKSLLQDSMFAANRVYDLNNTNYRFFFLPAYGYSSIKSDDKSSQITAHYKSFLTGLNADYVNGSTLTTFFSYDESANVYKRLDGNSIDFDGLFDNEGASGGLRYIWLLDENERFANSLRAQITGTVINTHIVSSRGVAKTKSYGYSADLDFVVDTIYKKKTFSTFLGFGYFGSVMKSFKMNYDPSIRYKPEPANLAYLRLGTKYIHYFPKGLKISLEGAMRKYINPDLKTTVNVEGKDFPYILRMPSFYAYFNASVGMKISNNVEFNLSYQGSGARTGLNHNGYITLNYFLN
ncbi:hypothetical protein OQH60_07805, partial [Campylobacter sp. MIT 21-1685]|uniref:hypothetical protein n=1 Tax=unclassified Campylobacter TaxID=2593542 RepID=UPI00224AD244